ncbi:MAG: hypothetical protein AABO41_00830 [Acidobacteriota bacterium]
MNKTFSPLEWLNIIGSVASIVGIALSVYVIYNLRQIRRSYMFTARAPDLLKRLKAHSSQVKKLLIDFDNSRDEIEAELALCSAVLGSLLNKVSRNERKTILNVIQLIAENRTLGEQSKDQVWMVYKRLVGVGETLRNLQKDKLWEK